MAVPRTLAVQNEGGHPLPLRVPAVGVTWPYGASASLSQSRVHPIGCGPLHVRQDVPVDGQRYRYVGVPRHFGYHFDGYALR